MPREPLTVRLAAWRTHRTQWWRAIVVGLAIALVAAFAGWHVGGDRARAEAEAWISANPPLVGWIVDNGPDLASSARDPREDVELHLLNVGRDPVIVRSMSATSDGAPVNVDLSSYSPTRDPDRRHHDRRPGPAHQLYDGVLRGRPGRPAHPLRPAR